MTGGGWLGRLLGLGHRTRDENERELRFHIEERIDRLMAEGWSRADAEAEVYRRFGEFDEALAECERIEQQRVRYGRVAGMIDGISRNVRSTARLVRRAPGYAATVVLTLAVGIGAATAMFSVLHGALLRPLPWGNADELVRVNNRFEATGGSGPFSIPNFLDVREATSSLSDMAGYGVRSITLTEDGPADRARALAVTANFLQVLGVQPARGRDFEPGADREGAERTLIVSQGAWQNRFAGDPQILGREVRVDGIPHRVVGVLPEDFWFAGDPQFIVPFAWNAAALADDNRGSRSLPAIGRLAPGFTPETAAAELTSITDAIGEQFPGNQEGWVATARSLRESMLGGVAGSVWLLMGAVGVVLLVACVNAANLMLVRGEQRTRETAVRAAIGAGRGALTFELLSESVGLAAVAGVLGIALADLFTRVLLGLWGDDLPRAASIGLDPVVLVVAVGLVLFTGLLVGLVPTLRLDVRRLQDVLRSGARGSAAQGSRLQRLLVVGEVALAVLLVSGAALLIQSFRNVTSVATGVDPDGAFTFSVQLPDTWAAPEERQRFFEDAVEGIQRLPGVEAVGISERTPMQGGYNITSLPSPDDPELEASFVEVRRVTPGFFAAAGLDLRRGRLFEANERGGAGVVVISETLAREIFPDGEWLGKRILTGWNDVGWEVVGVVESIPEFGLERELRPAVYWPFGETDPPSRMTFVVRTNDDDPAALAPEVRNVVAGLEAGAPVFGLRTFRDVMLETLGDRVFATTLFVAFGVLALLLAVVGVFSVLAHMVEQRTREIGIRLALGASVGGIQRMVTRETVALAGVGLMIGGAGALMSSSVLEGLLFGITATDPRIIGAVILIAAAGAVAASWLPTRRAMRVDPMEAMRAE
jgi:predicted permease